MNRRTHLWYGLLSVLLVLCLSTMVMAKRESASWNHGVEITSPSDWALLRDDVAAIDTTSCVYAALSGATTSVTVTQAKWVGISIRFAGSSDTCTIRPVFFDVSTATCARIGDPVDCTASTLRETSEGLYMATEGTLWWETSGNTSVIPMVTAISGTIDVWAGTR